MVIDFEKELNKIYEKTNLVFEGKKKKFPDDKEKNLLELIESSIKTLEEWEMNENISSFESEIFKFESTMENIREELAVVEKGKDKFVEYANQAALDFEKTKILEYKGNIQKIQDFLNENKDEIDSYRKKIKSDFTDFTNGCSKDAQEMFKDFRNGYSIAQVTKDQNVNTDTHHPFETVNLVFSNKLFYDIVHCDYKGKCSYSYKKFGNSLERFVVGTLQEIPLSGIPVIIYYSNNHYKNLKLVWIKDVKKD